MRTALLAVLAAIAAAAPASAGTGRERTVLRRYEAAYTSSRSLAAAHALIPAWARKYNMNCSGCHYPAPPRLNAMGQRFKWAGYRMPDEIGQKVDVEKIQNYVSGGGEVDFTYEKTSGTSAATTNVFSAPGVTLFYAGPFGRSFAGFFELEHGPDGEIERVAHISTIWGTEKSYGGFRAGQFHNFVEWGLAGFDRLPGPTMPVALDGPITGTIPFSLAGPRLGAEAYYVMGSNRLSAQVLNGITPDGAGDVGEGNLKKDVLVTDQVLLDNAGSGIQAVAYYGSVAGLDTLAPGLTSHFWRVGASANEIYRNFELLGGLIYAKDISLPGAAPDTKGVAYWVSGQYFVPKSSLTLYGRYEFLDPNTSATGDGIHRYVLGSVLPVTVPEYLRCAVEYHLDAPQGGLPKTNNLTAALTLTF
jgi:hypothetical protein